jgi:transcription initiation protein SPT3
VIDSLGFLCHEALSKIVEVALKVKKTEDERLVSDPEVPAGAMYHGLFKKPPGQQKPLQPRHIQEAFRLLQRSNHALLKFRKGIVRNSISLF